MNAAIQAAAALEPKVRDEAMGSIYDEISHSNPTKALALAKSQPELFGDKLNKLFATWMESDPALALQSLATLPAGDGRDSALQSVYPIWFRQDSAAALAALARMEGREREALNKVILEPWSQADPEAAARYYCTMSQADREKSFGWEFLKNVASKAPQTAIEMMKIWPDCHSQINEYIVRGWALHDLPGALAWIATIKATEDQKGAISGLWQVTNVSSERLIEAAATISDDSNRLHLFQTSIQKPDQVVAILPMLPAADAGRVLGDSRFASCLSELDPHAATTLVTTYGKGDTSQAWHSIAESYASKDPAAAYTWAQSLPAEGQATAMASVLKLIAQKDSADALQKAASITDPDGQALAYKLIANELAQGDPAKVNALMAELPPVAKRALLNSILQTSQSDNPARAAQMITDIQHNGTSDEKAMAETHMEKLAEYWSNTAPANAAAWSAQLTDGKAKDEFIGSLAKRWTESDAMAASIWIKSLPPGGSKDNAIGHLIYQISRTDPTSAIAWAGAVQDDTSRLHAYTNSLRVYLAQAPIAGRKAIEAAPIPEAEKVKLLQKPSFP